MQINHTEHFLIRTASHIQVVQLKNFPYTQILIH